MNIGINSYSPAQSRQKSVGFGMALSLHGDRAAKNEVINAIKESGDTFSLVTVGDILKKGQKYVAEMDKHFSSIEKKPITGRAPNEIVMVENTGKEVVPGSEVYKKTKIPVKLKNRNTEQNNIYAKVSGDKNKILLKDAKQENYIGHAEVRQPPIGENKLTPKEEQLQEIINKSPDGIKAIPVQGPSQSKPIVGTNGSSLTEQIKNI